MAINIIVRFLGTFQRHSGKKFVNLKFEDPLTIKEVIIKLTEVLPSKFKDAVVDSNFNFMQPNALVIINGKEISSLKGIETKVQDSSEVVLIPMVHGG